MTGRLLRGRESCVPLLPVITGTRRGLLRMLNMIGRWTQGTRKCVPSPDTVGNTPLNRSKITALSPPSTVGKVDENTVASHAIHFAVRDWSHIATTELSGLASHTLHRGEEGSGHTAIDKLSLRQNA